MTGSELLTAYAGGRRDFRGAYLRGVDFRDADLRGVDFRGAYLREADLRGVDMSKADLSNADLSKADLSKADLREAELRGVDLSDADLSDAAGLPDAPVVQDIDAAILAAIEGGGVLDMGQWHTCETTHCRAGWAIHLAGKAGAALERQHGANIAGALIYAASRPGKRVPNWFATNEEALADLRACAAGGA